MPEINKLLAWMQANNYNTESLAQAVGMSYDGVYQILYVRKRISPGFKVRFIQHFGTDIANSIFKPERVARTV